MPAQCSPSRDQWGRPLPCKAKPLRAPLCPMHRRVLGECAPSKPAEVGQAHQTLSHEVRCLHSAHQIDISGVDLCPAKQTLSRHPFVLCTEVSPDSVRHESLRTTLQIASRIIRSGLYCGVLQALTFSRVHGYPKHTPDGCTTLAALTLRPEQHFYMSIMYCRNCRVVCTPDERRSWGR